MYCTPASRRAAVAIRAAVASRPPAAAYAAVAVVPKPAAYVVPGAVAAAVADSVDSLLWLLLPRWPGPMGTRLIARMACIFIVSIRGDARRRPVYVNVPPASALLTQLEDRAVHRDRLSI